MKKFAIAFASLAAVAFAGAAFAEETTAGTWTTTTGPAAMSDSEMDGVTAGSGNPGFGNTTACTFANGTCDFPGQTNNRANPPGNPDVSPGSGRNTN